MYVYFLLFKALCPVYAIFVFSAIVLDLILRLSFGCKKYIIFIQLLALDD